MADVSFQSSLQSLLKKSKGLKWTGPGSYNVIKRTTFTPSVPLNNLEEYDESLLCSQLWAMLDSPDCPPLLCKCKRAGDDVTQCLRPANDATQCLCPADDVTQCPCLADDATQRPRLANAATQRLRPADDVTQCLRPANDTCVGKRPVTSSSMQPECGGDDAHVHKRV